MTRSIKVDQIDSLPFCLNASREFVATELQSNLEKLAICGHDKVGCQACRRPREQKKYHVETTGVSYSFAGFSWCVLYR